MTSPQTEATTDRQSIVAALQQRLDAGLAREATLAEELAARDAALAKLSSQYGNRIEQQAETVGDAEALKVENQELRAAQAAGLEVLQAMVASPGDTQPVFDLIARQAADLCAASAAAVAMLDGTILHLAKQYGYDPAFASVYATQFPRPVGSDTAMGRAILSHRAVQIEDLGAEPAYGMARAPGPWSTMAVPLLRGGAPLGVLAVGRPAVGRFPDNQVTLLQTFAEQAVIAITSAETYRALQTRTSDLQETLEYQTAISDVLKVISRSAFDLQPVLSTLLKTAARLCDADTAGMTSREGDTYRVVATFSNTPAFDTFIQGQSFTASRASVTGRTALEGRIVHVSDLAADPEYAVSEAVTLGGVRTLLGVPLLREGEVSGVIILGRFRVEPFTDRQIELVSTFADQAVIAIENTRLLTEQREALEQQTATAEVLQVINTSPGNLGPVFEAMLDKAMRLCDAAFGMFYAYDGTSFRTVVTRGVPAAFAAFRANHPPNPSPESPFGRAFETRRPVHVFDWLDTPDYKEETPGGRAIADLGGARTVLNVPLVKDTAVLGMI
jgi:GAF domain-containing protein